MMLTLTLSTLFDFIQCSLFLVSHFACMRRLGSQVYIVTMEQEKDVQKQKQSKQRPAPNVGGLSPADDADDDESQEFGDYSAVDGESLLSLVQPEMKMLSHHWLAALKDYALLSLPPGVMLTLASFSR